jgi:hypothetical protein
MRNYNSLNRKIILGLKKQGYYIVNNFLNNYECNKFKIRLQDMYEKSIHSKNYIDERSGYGQAIIRDVVLKDPKFFLELIDKKLIINVLSLLLKDKFILDGCVGSNSINVGSNHESLVHIDSHLPTKDPEFTSDVVVMYFFDNYKKENGATKIWPRSHLSGIRIQNDPNYKKNIKKKFKYVESNKGSIVFFLGHTWHQIGRNINSESRWGLLCHYKKWWIKPSTDFTKCGKSIFKLLNSKQKELFGFTSISPKFNFKTKNKKLRTLRKIEDISQDYFRAINY